MKFLRGCFKKNLVLVYTMGKVGSSYVERGFDASLHIHTLYCNPPSYAGHYLRFGLVGLFLRKFVVYPLQRAVLKMRRELFIISFHRDPTKRNPSMFFQDLPQWLSYDQLKFDSDMRTEDKNYLLTAFSRTFPQAYPQEWFAKELSKFSGVSAEDFNLGEKSYKVLKHKRITIFVGRCEEMDACEQVLAQDFGMSLAEKKGDQNRGTEKWYGPLYQVFQGRSEEWRDLIVEKNKSYMKSNGYSLEKR
jgi:hypothetical protein